MKSILATRTELKVKSSGQEFVELRSRVDGWVEHEKFRVICMQLTHAVT